MPALCRVLGICRAESLNVQGSWQEEIAGLCNSAVVTATRCKAKTVKSKSDPDSPLLPRWSLKYGDSK